MIILGPGWPEEDAGGVKGASTKCIQQCMTCIPGVFASQMWVMYGTHFLMCLLTSYKTAVCRSIHVYKTTYAAAYTRS
jgi:hypothetical protein